MLTSTSVQVATKTLTSTACKDHQKALADPEGKSETLHSFFSPQNASKENAPQVRSPTLVHADPIEPILMPGLSLLPPQKVHNEHIATPLADDM